MKGCIKDRVHELYWDDDINCARTVIICLSELFEIAIEQQTIWSAVGLHGAGGYRAQCGLVEGTLMSWEFISMRWRKQKMKLYLPAMILRLLLKKHLVH